MVITNLEEKENRKIWVPIRGGNRGGWSLFDWEKVREMPYRDREMYLGNSAKIGVLDKGGKWRKKDWYLKRNELTADQLAEMQSEAMRKDQERMNAALGYVVKDQEEKLTPAEMQLLLKKIKGEGKEEMVKIEGDAIGLGFDKTKVEIRAKPTAEINNPHRLQGTQIQQSQKKQERREEKESRKKHKKQKKEKKHRVRSESQQQKIKPDPKDEIEAQSDKKRRKHRSRSRSESYDRHKHRRSRSRSRSSSERRERDRKRERYEDSKHRDERRHDKHRKDKHRSRHESDSD